MWLILVAHKNHPTDRILLQSCRSWTGFPFVKEWSSSSRAPDMHQSLAGQTPTYLASDIQLAVDTGRPQLRSASERICVVPRTHNDLGDRSFSAAGPRVWNALPSYLRQDVNYTDISSKHWRQKVYAVVDHGAMWLFVFVHLRSSLSYLLLFSNRWKKKLEEKCANPDWRGKWLLKRWWLKNIRHKFSEYAERRRNRFASVRW